VSYTKGNVHDCNKLEEERGAIIDLAMDMGIKKIGFADLSHVGNKLTGQYPSGISLIVPMDCAIVDVGSDPDFFSHQMAQREEMEVIKTTLGKLLAGYGHRCHSVSNDMDASLLTGELSHKMVASQAGLGWIGKSSLFITPEYGPRVRLTSLLTDAPYKTATEMMKSQCGDCRLCADACPADAIHNKEWAFGMGREELLDFNKCADYRQKLGDGLGRRHSCAYCLKACPIGRE
jgi:epoxyqueuosine reductase